MLFNLLLGSRLEMHVQVIPSQISVLEFIGPRCVHAKARQEKFSIRIALFSWSDRSEKLGQIFNVKRIKTDKRSPLW